MPDAIETMPLELGGPLGVAWAVGLAWLLLFGLRRRIGASPLAAAIVALHAWAVVDTAAVAPAPGLTVASSWLTLTAWPMIVALVHIRDGTHRARQLAVSVLVGTFLVTAVGATLAVDPVAVLIRGLSRGVLAYLAALCAVVTWEILANARVPVPLRLIGAVLLSLSFDATAQGGFDALLAREPFERHVLGAVTMSVVTASMHGALGALWLLLLEGARWTASSRERALWPALAVMLGIQRYERMRTDMVRDASSGIYHRTFLEDRAPIELERAEHMAAPLAIVVIDARDEPARIGRALLSSMRLTDLPARWSEQRYVAVLPGADREAARVTATRAVEAFRGEAAVGIAIYPQDGGDLEALIDRARRHLHPIDRERARAPATT